LNVDVAEMVKRPLFNRERHDEAFSGGVVDAGRRYDLNVGKAVLEVEAPDQIAIGLDAILIIDVRRLQETEEIRFRGLDHLFDAPCRIGVVADENNLLDAGLFAFADFENQIDAVVRTFDDLWRHRNVEAPVTLIDFDDALDVGLYRRFRQRAALLRLDFLVELLVLEPVIAFIGNAIDDLRFDHRDDQLAARLGDVDVQEQAGRVERLQCRVDPAGVESSAGSRLEVRANSVGFDTAVAFDDDCVCGYPSANRRRRGGASK